MTTSDTTLPHSRDPPDDENVPPSAPHARTSFPRAVTEQSFRPTADLPHVPGFPDPVKTPGFDASKEEDEKEEPKTQAAPKTNRVDTTPLEGVRALACAIIAANHWSLWYGEKKHGAIELQGGFAVTVFFFITGFVMYLAYGNKVGREDFDYWDFIKRRYVRLVPVHWLCIVTYTPVIVYNYHTIANDYYFWQNASGEKHLWAGWLLNPFFLSSWIGSPLHYWNSVGWSISTQVGFYFMFPRIARAVKKKLYLEEGGLVVSVRHTAHTKEGESNDKTKNKKGEKQIVTTGALQETDDALIDLRYTRRFRMLYFLSIVIPFAAMAFFNNPAFREYWSGPDVQRDPETGKETVTELGSDVDGIRAYFLARSWTPFRLPVFLLGVLFAAKRTRMRRMNTDTDQDTTLYYAQIVDKYSFRLFVFWVFAAAFSLAFEESKPVRLFSEFFLLYPAAYVIFGLTIAGRESRTYRLLTHPLLLLGGKISYAAYLLQFPVWTYIDRMAYGTFGNRFPPCSRDNPEAAESWSECFSKSGYQEWPDIMVVWNVFLLFVVAYVVNKYFEQRAVAWLASKVLRQK